MGRPSGRIGNPVSESRPRITQFAVLGSESEPFPEAALGCLTAIDLDTGTFRWRSVLGVVDHLIERGVPPTGGRILGGSLVTALPYFATESS